MMLRAPRVAIFSVLLFTGVLLSVTGCNGFFAAMAYRSPAVDAQDMTVSAEQLAGIAFPQGMHNNVYISRIKGTDRILNYALRSEESRDPEDSSAITASLRQSFRAAGLNSDNRETAGYLLSPVIVKNPSMGLFYTSAEFTIEYVMKETSSGEIVLSDSISSSCKSPGMSHKAMLHATECAIRNNFHALLQRLGQPSRINGVRLD